MYLLAVVDAPMVAFVALTFTLYCVSIVFQPEPKGGRLKLFCSDHFAPIMIESVRQ